MRRLLPFLLVGLLGLGSALAVSAYLQHRLLASLPSRLSPAIASRRAVNAPRDVLGEQTPDSMLHAEARMEQNLRALESMQEGTEVGALRFDNPDVIQLVHQFRDKLRYLQEREARLQALDDRIRLELQNLSVMTQWVHQAESAQQSLLSNRMAYIRAEEQRALGEHARRLQALPVAQAVALISQYPMEEIARTLQVMGSSNAAPLLGGIIASGPEGAKMAADVSKQMQRLSLMPPPESTNAAAVPTSPGRTP